MTAKESRFGEPRIAIEVGEEPTVCGYCGARTEILEVHLDSTRIEECLGCRQQYHVTDVIEDIGEEAPQSGFEPSEMSNREGVEATADDLQHLFGTKPTKPSPYPDFGSF